MAARSRKAHTCRSPAGRGVAAFAALAGFLACSGARDLPADIQALAEAARSCRDGSYDVAVGREAFGFAVETHYAVELSRPAPESCRIAFRVREVSLRPVIALDEVAERQGRPLEEVEAEIRKREAELRRKRMGKTGQCTVDGDDAEALILAWYNRPADVGRRPECVGPLFDG